MSRLVILYFGSLMFRSLLIGVLAWTVTIFLRGVANRHAVWVAVLLIMVLLPVFDAILPGPLVPGAVRDIVVQRLPDINWLRRETTVEFSPVTSTPPYEFATERRINGWNLVLFSYVLITATSLLRLALGYRTLAKVKASSGRIAPAILARIAEESLPVVYESETVLVPLAAGIARPYILLPINWKSWDEWKLRAVLSHELTHIQRRDFGVAVLAAINSCVHWFNPLAWWVQGQLRSLAEHACDEASILRAGDPVRYAEILLQFSFATQGAGRIRVGGVAMAGQFIKSRIKRVLTIEKPGNGMLSNATWAVIFMLAAPVLYLSAAIHGAPESTVQELVSPLAAWVERVAAIITPEERLAYQGLQSDSERQHFIEQFWSRRFPSWPDEVAYIIRDEERIAYQSLKTEEERQHFIEQFWQRMDPSPGTPENEFKNEYFRRLEYAKRAFVEPSAWWKADRGRIYIMYGEPNKVDAYATGGLHVSRQGEVASYPFLRWQYRRINGIGDNVAFDFQDPTRTGEFHLAPPGTLAIGSISPQSNTVEEVRIRGNGAVPMETIKANIQTNIGDRLDQGVVTSDVQRLYGIGSFDDVSAEITGGSNGGKVVTFDVTEKLPARRASGALPFVTLRTQTEYRIGDVKVVGATVLNEAQIKDLLGLVAGEVYNESRLARALRISRKSTMTVGT
jgi:GWxTD domain-containing protein